MTVGYAWQRGCVKPLDKKAALRPRKTPPVSGRRKSLILRQWTKITTSMDSFSACLDKNCLSEQQLQERAIFCLL